MRKSGERLIEEFLAEHPGAVLYVRADILGGYEVGVSGENHTHAGSVAEGVRRYWAADFLTAPGCAERIRPGHGDRG